MYHTTIDINADVGEGVGNEAQLLPLISSCNIACGGHAGDTDIMREVVRLAKENKVKIGAHPSFPDKEYFGRKDMDMSCAALFSEIKDQIKRLLRILREEQATLHHIKPHGALYNKAATDKITATVVVEAIKGISMPMALYVPYGSVIAEIARQENVPVIYEAFADRNYNDDLTLISRSEPNAVITDANEMFAHVYRMAVHQKVKTISGAEVPIRARTYCIHGDNPKALELTKKLREKLHASGVKIQ